MNFKNYLLNEETEYFGSKIGDILNAIQELAEGAGNMGTRHLARLTQTVCNEIRGVLRSRWSVKQRPYLEQLQKVGVALMKSVEEQGDLPQTLASAAHELETLSGKIGTPLNQMGSGLAENVILG